MGVKVASEKRRLKLKLNNIVVDVVYIAIAQQAKKQ